MGEQVAAGIKKRKPLKRVFYKNGHVPMGLDKGEACDARAERTC